MACKIILKDEVNCKIEGLDPDTRKKIEKELKSFSLCISSPAYKLGRWDGCVSYFTIGGVTYTNLLDIIIPIIVEENYTIELDDQRNTYDFDFEKVVEDSYSNITWPKGHPVEGQPVMLRDYQVEIVNKFLETPHCLQEIATGAGKTLVTASPKSTCRKVW